MIISASRRTDIPAYYSDWFCNRLREGFVCVRTPMNFHQVSRIALSSDVVDGIVFWTKDPRPLMPRLEELRAYPYYFQFTLTPYGKDMEPGLPDKGAVLLPAFQMLSDMIGPERVIWRYDPILLTARYTADFHITAFRQIVPFPVSWTVKMKKKQKETQDILSYHTQAAGCSDKARAKASGGRQPIEECGRTGL